MHSPAQTTKNAAHMSLHHVLSQMQAPPRFNVSLDTLVVAGRSILAHIAEAQLPVTLVLGTLRFSLVRLYHKQIIALAPFCSAITVYGEADCEPPSIPGVDCIALPAESPLCNEWFLLAESSEFWGGIVSKISARHDAPTGERALTFNGSLITDESVGSSCLWALWALGGSWGATPERRYQQSQQRHWSEITSALQHAEETHRSELAHIFSPMGVTESLAERGKQTPLPSPQTVTQNNVLQDGATAAHGAHTISAALARCGAVLQEPLRNLRDSLTTIGSEGGLSQAQLTLLGQAMRISSGLVLLSNELARFPSKAMLDPRVLTPVRIDQMAQAAIDTLYAESGRRGQQVLFSAPTAPALVYGDEGLLSHAVSTLINNAIVYSAPGSTIWVNCQSTETDMLFIVSNPAPELRAEDCGQLFVPFHRIASTARRDPQGRGLSLALVEAALHCHGGDASATWTSNDGRLILTLRIPLGHPGLNEVSHGISYPHR